MTERRVALVVEDNPADARLVQEHLHESAPQFRFVHVEKLAPALEYLRREHAHIVLLDAQLPDSQGLNTVEQIHKEVPTTPIVVLTGNDDAQFGAACLESGAQDFVVKQHATPALLAWAVRNADARKRVELALQDSEANYRGLFENSCFPIAQIHPDGTIVRANRGFTTLLGIPDDAEVYGDIARYFVDAKVFHALTEFQRSAFHDVETTWKRADGSRATVSLSGRHVTSSGPGGGWIEIIAQDIGERRALEDQLRQAQKLEAVAQLAGGVAHDLNNVLAIIMAEVESAGAARQAGSQASIDLELEAIQDTARRGARLVKHLLGYSRQQHLSRRPIELNHLVADIVEMVRRIVPKTIHLAFISHSENYWAAADPTAVEQMLLNLITNARDAVGPEGTVTVSTDLVKVSQADMPRHSQTKPGTFVRIRVTDDGVGMSPEVQGRVFEPFYSTKPKGVGTGLGLSSVHGLAAQHDGYVLIESAPREGTSVDIYLPSVKQPTDAVGVEERKLTRSELTGTDTILLVDDETGLRKVGRRLLERFGYCVYTAASGQDALELYRGNAKSIDLIITDVVMPGMSGFELREAILSLNPAMPFLFMSGYSEEELPQIVDSDSPISIIEKPWEVSQMLTAVRRIVDRDREIARLLAPARATVFAPCGKTGAAARSRAAALTMTAELKDAVRHSRFHIHFQPEYDFRAGHMAAAEALLRWKRKNGTVVPPAEFIPILEECGLMSDVGTWVIAGACASLSQFRRKGFTNLRMAVNVTADQLVDSRFIPAVERSLAAANIEPSALELELAEGSLTRDATQIQSVLRDLRAIGVRVAIDHFGSGLSSLAHLSAFDIDVLKVDRSFVTPIDGDDRHRTVVNGVVDLARQLGLDVVAEGVETQRQVQRLRECQCEVMQGYFFGKPSAELRRRTFDMTLAC